MSIRLANVDDFEMIFEVINAAAEAYREVIPADCWHEPYMSRAELTDEISAGVEFSVLDVDGVVAAVMGMQDKVEVMLVRHAYTAPTHQGKGLGSQLLAHVRAQTAMPVLIGTWAAAAWAVRFYETHGFRVVGASEKNRLLKQYWTVPERQIETSVVLVDERWGSRG